MTDNLNVALQTSGAWHEHHLWRAFSVVGVDGAAHVSDVQGRRGRNDRSAIG
jgi:hypothetical protein